MPVETAGGRGGGEGGEGRQVEGGEGRQGETQGEPSRGQGRGDAQRMQRWIPERVGGKGNRSNGLSRQEPRATELPSPILPVHPDARATHPHAYLCAPSAAHVHARTCTHTRVYARVHMRPHKCGAHSPARRRPRCYMRAATLCCAPWSSCGPRRTSRATSRTRSTRQV